MTSNQRAAHVPIVMAAAVALLMLSFAACAPSADTSESAVGSEPKTTTATPLLESAEVRQRGLDVVAQLLAGDTESVLDGATAQVKGAITADGLTAAWEQAIFGAGEYQLTLGARVSQAQGLDVVQSYLQYANRVVRVTTSFDSESKLAGVFFATATAAEVADLAGAMTTDTSAAAVPEGAERVAVGEHELPGILTVPATAPSAVVVMLGGSGPTDADSTVGANKPFAQLATALRDSGFASLRFDKRYAAHPELAESEPVTMQAEYLDDVAAAIELVRDNPKTAGTAVVLLGHSQGAMVAPAVLAADPGLAGGVLLAGSPRSLWQIMLDQQLDAIEISGKNADEQADLVAQARAQTALAEAVTDPSGPGAFGLPASYVASVNALDHAALASGLTMPLFVAHGEADSQASVERDFEAWRPVLAGNPSVEYHRYPGLNHIFMPTQGKTTIEEYAVPGELDPAFLADLTRWLGLL